jgi:hypothetical protein
MNHLVIPMAASSHRRQADIEVRKALLLALEAPLGSVNVLRRPSKQGDILVVQMASSIAVPQERQMAAFHGFPVVYEKVAPARGGWWK